MRRIPQTRLLQAHTLAGRLLALSKRRWLAPMAAMLLLLTIIAGAIIVTSVTQQHVQLDDGTVWVTSLKNRKVARFNVKLKQADAAISASSQRFDVTQHDSNTLLDEQGKISSIKASTISIEGSAQTGGDTVTMIGGSTAAFLNPKNGNVWAGKASDAASISPANARPNMKLGTGGLAVVDSDGVVWGYRPSDGMVLRLVNPINGQSAATESITGGKRRDANSFTVVSGIPVIISSKQMVFKGGEVDLDVNGQLVLQSPAVDGEQSGWVAIASPNGLITVTLNEANPRVFTLTSGGKGEPAQPVSSGGCVHAAFSQKTNNYVRVCSAQDSKAEYATLKEVNTTSQLAFRTNHRQVVLNDVINGNVWNPNNSANAIKIQWNTIQTEQREQQNPNDNSANNSRNFTKTCSTQSGQIKAQDDDFGARVGSQQILDVLRNDEQTDCSVLHITRANAPAGGNVSVWPIYDGRYLQFDASNAHAGTASFSYEISDGHGQSSSATVHVKLTDEANNAPSQSDIPPEISLEQGATYTMNALGSFTDPDGDPLTLVSAAASNSDQVTITTRADGQLVFNAGAATSGRIGVEVTASDGEETGTGMIYFSIKPANTLAADIDPVVTSTLPDTDTTIELKQYVHGTSAQPAQLSSVESPDNTRATMNAADMTIQFTATQTGTYYVPYTITQGSIPTTGLVRVEVQPSSSQSAKPIAANDVAVLGSDNTAVVEPLNNDVDPTGGVLSITSVSAEASSGIKTGLVGNKRVYLTALQTPTKPIKVSYTVMNAVGATTGTITLQPPSLSNANSTPKAGNVNAQVRTDGIVSVDVLDHVSYSDGTTVTLENELQTDTTTFKGLAFVSGNTVRYQASTEPGVYPITYTVKDNLGNVASGTITIAVHKKNADSKAAPTPRNIQAQAAAGQKVRIAITLTGIDVDGDDIQLLGLGNKAPQLGRIAEVGADYLMYEAYEDSSGTDTFSYAVEDWTGQRAQAQIRVGVFQSASNSGVVARNDSITLRPNTAATVPVALNDISGDNTELRVESKLQTQGITSAKVNNNMISFTAPSEAGTSYIVYTITDNAGLKDTGTLTVNVDPNAPIKAPDAYDYHVPAASTIDKKSVDVDVSQWISNPSGSLDELEVSLNPSAKSHAQVKGGKHSTVISVELTDEARAVPYTVRNTTYDITSTAFIYVPAYGVFPPVLRPKTPALKVNAGETIEINIADYVRVGAGKTPYVDGANSVSATKAANSDLYVSDGKLKFTAAKDYAGSASITFTAADSKRRNDSKIINTAVLTLLITVIGRDMPAPTFSSPTIDVVAGEDATIIDLKALTHSLNATYEESQEYTYSGGGTSGKITAHVSANGQMRLRAEQNASPGTTMNIPIQIAYAKGIVTGGVSVRVVASLRPLARTSDKEITLKAGSSETVNLFDDAYNPFPETPLRAVKCISESDSKLSVVCNASGAITISAAKNIGASFNKVIVTVEDGTGSEERKITGAIIVSVIDRPEAPLLSPIDTKAQDGAVELTWTSNSSNGSPITEYEVAYSGPSEGVRSCGAVTTCKVTELTNGQTYTFTVRAKNDVGWSQYSNTATGTPDTVPDAPSDVHITGEQDALTIACTVTWLAPQGKFSAPISYNVTIVGSNGWTDTHTVVTSTSDQFNISDDVLATDSSFTARVTAVNEVGESAAGISSESWNINIDTGTVSSSITCNKRICTLSWNKLAGRVNGTIVNFGSHYNESHGASGTLTTELRAWETAPSAAITPVFNNRQGVTVRDNSAIGYIYKQAPTIDTETLQLTWDNIDRNVINVTGLDGINNYARDDITTFSLEIDGTAKEFDKQTSVIDASDITGTSASWTLTVTMDGDPNYQVTQSNIPVMGTRAGSTHAYFEAARLSHHQAATLFAARTPVTSIRRKPRNRQQV